MRILFLTEIALWKYRAQLSGFELPEGLLTQQRQLDNGFALTLEAMADRLMADQLEMRSFKSSILEDSVAHQVENAQAYLKMPEQTLSDGDPSLLSLRRRIQDLTNSLTQESELRQRVVLVAGFQLTNYRHIVSALCYRLSWTVD